MITLALLKYLEDEGLGEIDKTLFWEKLTLGKTGLYIQSIGNATDRGARKMQSFTLYARGKTDVEGRQILEQAIEALNGAYGVCDLPGITGITEGYKNITIMPMSTISNDGLDENGRLIWTATGNIYY